jgi:hypothetical protein
MTTTALPTLTARTPEDVLAAVPLVLGFAPEESVVMLTSGAVHPFHARLDLPRTGRERRSAGQSLVGPAVRHRVERVMFVMYTADAALARSCARVLVRIFVDRGVDVADVLRSDASRWFPVRLEGEELDGAGTPYDVMGHLFTAQAVAAGRVTRGSRRELAETVAADVAGTAAVAAAVEESRAGPGGGDPASLPGLVAGLVAGAGPPEAETAARVLLAVAVPAGRDQAMGGVTREQAERQLPVWSALVRVAPSDLLAPAASVLAFLAWLAGDGALAWCALDRAAEGDPPCTLAQAMAEALDLALPPDVWEAR